jgi:hypothetical protein
LYARDFIPGVFCSFRIGWFSHFSVAFIFGYLGLKWFSCLLYILHLHEILCMKFFDFCILFLVCSL